MNENDNEANDDVVGSPGAHGSTFMGLRTVDQSNAFLRRGHVHGCGGTESLSNGSWKQKEELVRSTAEIEEQFCQ